MVSPSSVDPTWDIAWACRYGPDPGMPGRSLSISGIIGTALRLLGEFGGMIYPAFQILRPGKRLEFFKLHSIDS